jgi:hypothetical protein
MLNIYCCWNALREWISLTAISHWRQSLRCDEKSISMKTYSTIVYLSYLWRICQDDIGGIIILSHYNIILHTKINDNMFASRLLLDKRSCCLIKKKSCGKIKKKNYKSSIKYISKVTRKLKKLKIRQNSACSDKCGYNRH